MSVREKIIEVLRRSDRPLNINCVCRRVGSSWYYVKALLFELLAKNMIQAQETSDNKWIFWLDEDEVPVDVYTQ